VNPALPGGALATDAELDAPGWAVRARSGYTFAPYRKLQQGRDEAPNPNGLAVDVHLATFQAIVTAPTGTSLDLQLPAGTLATTLLGERRLEHGIGDLEVRFRQGLGRLVTLPLDVGISVGAVLPTGRYVARSGAANLPPEASYLTLGRGTTWALLELDARVPFAGTWTALAQTTARLPLARTSDGFAWGSEVRGTLGILRSVTRRVSLVATMDLQWRDGATEPDPFSSMRLPSANAGGWQWTVAPSIAWQFSDAFTVLAGARVPLASDVTGNQLVPQTGVFVALAYVRRMTPRPASPIVAPTPGTITVVDYWATWCAPCERIERALTAAQPRWPDVRIVKVDASLWPGDRAPALPAGVNGLPAIEILDGSGARLALLVGEDALRVVERVDALRRRLPLQ
jgi:thiol-disulfide isomerase/thioredoxin